MRLCGVGVLIKFSIILLLAACSPVIHDRVENMSELDRTEFLNGLPSSQLCNAYFKPWAKAKTKNGIQKILMERKFSGCPNLVRVKEKAREDQVLKPKVNTEIRRGGSSRIYRRGPRGGCYYIAGSGKKVYVDRWLCR